MTSSVAVWKSTGYEFVEDGYSTDLAWDGAEGLPKARVYDYDLLVLDVLLPGKTGFESYTS